MDQQDKKKRERKREINVDLPQDIIDDILVRLPAKTLIRFKSVCVSWFSLISDPKFIKRHLVEYSLSTSKQRLLLCYRPRANHNIRDKDYIVKSCPLDFYSDNDALATDHPTTKPTHKLSIFGSCNGLVCVRIGDSQIFLWNPSINKSKELPIVGELFSNYDLCSYGFGYDQNIDDYKVVRIFYNRAIICPGKREVQVYSLNADSWRKINDFPYHVPDVDERGVYVNGVLHWKVGINIKSMVIVSFDLGNETFGEVSQPCYGEGYVYDLSLGVLEGCLSILCAKTFFDIWVMKEYRVGGTWTKLYSFAKIHFLFDYHIPLCNNPMTGEVLFLIDNRFLILYNPSKGEQIRDKLAHELWGLQAITYIESLVSPYIDDKSRPRDKSMERW